MIDDSVPQADLEAAQQRQQRRQRYEQWMERCILGGISILFASMALWAVFDIDAVLWAGSFALPLGYVGYIAINSASPMKVRDEREMQIENEAGRLAIYIVGLVFVTVTPLATAADTTGWFDVPEILWGVIIAYVFLFTLTGATSWWVKRQH
ncbi:hypothetical protein ACFQJ7_01220 [Halovenus rubra]|uniref:Uncharacterized protein n=2 Tax=Halovenus rubra TaxID=869890 RepID=A0ACC7E0Q6_9EURY|nr:hypothetical protein [Halovenus rubra]